MPCLCLQLAAATRPFISFLSFTLTVAAVRIFASKKVFVFLQPKMAGLVPPVTTTIPADASKTKKADEKTDYMNLPCPIPFEEIHREALMYLWAQLKFLLNLLKPLKSLPLTMNLLMLIGRVLTDGRLNARVKWDLTDNFTVKANAQLTNEPHMSHGMFNFDYKGKDYRSQFQIGNGALFGASYFQSVSPHLSLGGEVFWAGQHRKSGIGYAGRYETDKMVATGQVASTGMVALSYVQKVSEKVSLASDFMYNYMSKDATASVGYDYILRQCRLRGKIDSNGCTTAFLEERLNMGLNFILSAEIDHKKKDYKFGFGLTVG
ncbi:Mitochondrial import receptor subunit TOM40 -like protein [Gossypium arboreum]|uniref:Mitochondrial import receptor subunit TOM40-like protein n=1 Tax=Gossypium arboreum TaxID=29729 RepID=A0A0B0MMM3_GOSAR|nr:Mitochondrial import receptor subunit TOM40 -like protein [Gossypium arboreum]